MTFILYCGLILNAKELKQQTEQESLNRVEALSENMVLDDAHDYLVANPEFKKVKNGFYDGAESTSKSIPISVISFKMAHYLFEMFKRDKSFPFDYLTLGCQANAHKMSLIAEKYNIYFGKIYAEGRLQVKTDNEQKPFVRWGWHVAPVVFIREGNKDNLKVIDPSIFDQPVSVSEWIDKMLYNKNGFDAYVTTYYYGNRYQYYPHLDAPEDYKNNWNNLDLFLAEYERLKNLVRTRLSQ